MEVKLIAELNTQQPNGFNIAPGGERPPKLTAETLPRWRATMQAKRDASWVHHEKGKKYAHRGVAFTEEHKKNISESRKGKKHSDETRKKLSDAKKGKSPWNKGKPGPKQSEETKAKRAATMQAKRSTGWTNTRKHK